MPPRASSAPGAGTASSASHPSATSPAGSPPARASLIGDDAYVSEGTWQQGKSLLIKLGGVDNRWAAARLQGATLETPEAEAPALPEGAFYQHQIVGLTVRTTDGRDLGALAEIIETGSNDVYVVRGPEGESLIPAIPDIVLDVDLSTGVITIETVPGLL